MASYRGPLIPNLDSTGEVCYNSATGGLVQVLASPFKDRAVTWLSASEVEVRPLPAPEGYDLDLFSRLSYVAISAQLSKLHYEVVSNSLLWPMFHQGFDEAYAPTWDAHLTMAWKGYEAVNRQFTDAIDVIAPRDGTVVVHDYQLMLVPGQLRQQRPDLRLAYFHHIPFVSLEALNALIPPARSSILASLRSVPTGFQAARWRRAFESCIAAESFDDSPLRPVSSFVIPVQPDLVGLEAKRETPSVRTERKRIREIASGRKVIARVDRGDPVKNSTRAIRAFDEFLSGFGQWIDKVVLIQHLVPTRSEVKGYREYIDEISEAIVRVNAKWSTASWTPIVLNLEDNHDMAMALLAEYDVLIVNPIREGMNLVSLEGPLLNERDGLLILSTECGSYDVLNDATLSVHPLDILGTARAIGEALNMSPQERSAGAAALKSRVAALLNMPPWHDQVARRAT